jgi:hypothetical protein
MLLHGPAEMSKSGPVVVVGVVRPRAKHPLVAGPAKQAADFVRQPRLIGQAGIAAGQKIDVADAEHVAGSGRLAAAHGCQLLAHFERGGGCAFLAELAARHESDVHRDAALDQHPDGAAAAKSFVVGMRGQNQDLPLIVWMQGSLTSLPPGLRCPAAKFP